MRSSKIVCAALMCCLAACGLDDGDGPPAGEDQDGFTVATATGELEVALDAVSLASWQNVKSGRCIGVSGASTANGALIQQFTCDGTSNQNWRGASNAAGQNTLTNQKSGRCMGVSGASTASGAVIAQFTCDGSTNQKWVLVGVGGTTTNPIVNFRNVKSGLCIGVNGASTANGAQLAQFRCDGLNNQQWRGIPRA
jgi:hypothetical protein